MACTLLMQDADLLRKLEMSQIKKQIEVLATFMPDEILNMPFSELDKVQNFVGVLLFADVSGFTPMCEKYNKTGKGGIYRLTATLNAYIGAIVEVIYFYGGDVLKFSGDAFLAMWKADPSVCMYKVIHEVIVCALFIQQTLGRFETEVNVLLKVKLAISCGNMTFSIIGDDIKHYVLLGPAINDVKAAEHASVSGDVVIAPTAWSHIAEEGYDVTLATGGNVKVWRCLYKPNEKGKKDEYDQKHITVQKLCERHIKHRNALHAQNKFDSTATDSKLTEEFVNSLPERQAMSFAPKKWIVSDLSPYIIKPVQEQVNENQPLEYLTEMREVTIQFINIVPTTYYEPKIVVMIDRAYKSICSIVGKVLGVVNKVSLFDKDAMLLVLFGLRGIKHELESQNALKSGFRIRQAISKLEGVSSVSVGVTNGLVYCGVVGHPLRREYTVIGGSVNKAARIMCAYTDKVTCDYTTYKNSKLASCYFQLQSALKLKGIEDAGHIFEYNEDFQEMLSFVKQISPILGRDKELDLVHDIICHPQKCFTYRAVCYYGKLKIGKSRLLIEGLRNSMEEGHTVAAVYLCGQVQRPYYCVSMLYKQLYNGKTLVNSKDLLSIRELPRNIWDLNDVMQFTANDRKGKITDMFRRMAQAGYKGRTVIFVDNAQYIDIQSLDVIIDLLKTDCLRMICAGNFEEESTWDLRYKMRKSEKIKFIELVPLKRGEIAPLICQFLNVKGAHKKLVSLIVKSCEGRPGWVQASILRQVNIGGLEIKYVKANDEEVSAHYTFPDLSLIDDKYEDDQRDIAVIPVADICENAALKNDQLTLAAISMDLFDSFTPYEQLVIKTAAVLGEIFTRDLLIVMLKYPNELNFCTAMARLYEEDAFDCGTRYVSSGGLAGSKLECHCFMVEEELKAFKKRHNMPKYAVCKLIHFKNKSLRAVAYELLPANQRKELHLRTTDLMEQQNNSCPNCLRNNSAAIIKLKTFKDIMLYANNPGKSYGVKDRVDQECNPEEIKDVIRNAMRKGQAGSKEVVIPKRKVWDPSVCFCLEILVKVYADLIYHAEHGGHLGKRIFFLMQYGVILVTMDECDEAVKFLHEASELCLLDAKQPGSLVSDAFRRLHIGKIHLLLAGAQVRIGDLKKAKNHLAITLRQYNVPMTALRYTIPSKIMNRFCLTKSKNTLIGNSKQRKCTIFKSDLAVCMNLASNIYAAEGHWSLAKQAAARSLNLLKESNSNVTILCDIYSSAIKLYHVCGSSHTCERLERSIVREVLRRYTGGVILELHALCKLIYVIFQTRLLSGNISTSIKIGYRAFDLNKTVHATYLQVQLLPVLATLLLLKKRIEDAVQTIRILRNIGKSEDDQGLVGYYAFCIELNVETSFQLEKIEACEQFTKGHLIKMGDRGFLTPLELKLLIYLQCYYMRHGRWSDAFRWKEKYRQDRSERVSYMAVCNHLIYTQCALLLLVRGLQLQKQFIELEQKKIEAFLAECDEAARKWKVFKARTLHLRAYFYRIKGKTRLSSKYTKKALAEANSCKNTLETCWVNLNESAWNGGFSFGNETRCVDWILAKTYTDLQWSQIMFPLPVTLD